MPARTVPIQLRPAGARFFPTNSAPSPFFRGFSEKKAPPPPRNCGRGKSVILTRAMVPSYPVKLLSTVPETSITKLTPPPPSAAGGPIAIKSDCRAYNKCTNKHGDLDVQCTPEEESIERWKMEAINYSRISAGLLLAKDNRHCCPKAYCKQLDIIETLYVFCACFWCWFRCCHFI